MFRQCNEMSLKVTKRNSFPCTSAKNSDESGIFRASKKFLVSVKGLGKRCPADCKTVYPGSIPGVASNKINESAQALRRQRQHLPTRTIGPHDGEAARERLVVP